MLWQSQAELSDIESLLRFVQFIPLEDEILDFFRPVAAHIMQHLRAKPCLPTQGTNCRDDDDEDYKLLLPVDNV